ncbi:MAG TPA: ABC transporter permease subunit [Mycobacterium sp.]|jgi:ABC-2 type transport system permease protein|nr:ABC transporter permease subunit [Mycobacterium sp.]
MIALISTEFTKAARRTRTLIVALVLVALPIAISVAVRSGTGPGNNRDRAPDDVLFKLAKQSGLLVPVGVLSAIGGFLLVVIAGTFAGDSVAGDAAWGNLRYLLMRPVARGRLLMAKAFVAGVLIWAATIFVALVGLAAGIAIFGAHPVNVTLNPGDGAAIASGFHLSTGALFARVSLATAYVAFGYTALLALGIFLSTLTDAAAGAISATVGIYILSLILDGISALGRIRYLFPTHYLNSWTTMFTDNQFSHDMLAGAVVQIAYLVVFGGAALIWFRRKDIRS